MNYPYHSKTLYKIKIATNNHQLRANRSVQFIKFPSSETLKGIKK